MQALGRPAQAAQALDSAAAAGGCQLQGSRTDRSSWLVICGRRVAKAKGHALILLGCRLKLPAELEHEFATVDFVLRPAIIAGDRERAFAS